MPSSAPQTPQQATIDWVRTLVRLPTESSQSNLAVIDAIADHLRSLRVPVRLTYDESRRKANLFASIGERRSGGIVLSGHTDTVPWAGQPWSRDPLGGEIVRDSGPARLHGRGSADMKGFVGVVVAQAGWLLEAQPRAPIHFAFSYDEEVGCLGVKALLADLQEAGIRPRMCIVGEPTGMVPVLAHKSAHRWRCCVRGKAVHSSLAPHGVNAIDCAHALMAQVMRQGEEWQASGRRDPRFDVPFSTATVTRVSGGVAENIVPDACDFSYEFRTLPATDAALAQRRLEHEAEHLLQGALGRFPGTSISFERSVDVPAFAAAENEPAARLAMALSGASAPTAVAFGTEAGLFQQAGMSTVICGPGSIEQAHQSDEYVTLSQLAQCERFVRGLAATPA